MTDRNRLKITYPVIRRQPRPGEASVTTIVSETIIRATETLTLGAPGLFINNGSLCLSIENWEDPYQRMLVVTGTTTVAPPA